MHGLSSMEFLTAEQQIRITCLQLADGHIDRVEKAGEFYSFIVNELPLAQPETTDEYVAEGSSLFSEPKKRKPYTRKPKDEAPLISEAVQSVETPQISPKTQALLDSTAPLVQEASPQPIFEEDATPHEEIEA